MEYPVLFLEPVMTSVSWTSLKIGKLNIGFISHHIHCVMRSSKEKKRGLKNEKHHYQWTGKIYRQQGVLSDYRC